MVTALAIMVITAALAVGSVTSLRTHTVVREAAESLQQAVAATRQGASALGRCTRLEIVDASGTAVASGTPGVALRLRTWSSAHCELGAPDALDAGGELRRLPLGVTATRNAPADPVLADWLPSGRTRHGDSALFTLATSDATLAVVAAAHGPVCIRDATTWSCP